MPGPQEQPTIVVNMTDYPALRDAKKVKLMRLQPDRYQLAIRKFSAQDGSPADPDVLPLNRAGAEAFAKGLESANADLQKQIDNNNKAISNLRTALVADMDALDAAAKAEGDI